MSNVVERRTHDIKLALPVTHWKVIEMAAAAEDLDLDTYIASVVFDTARSVINAAPQQEDLPE